MKVSWQAAGRFGPSRPVPNTPSSLIPKIVRTAIPSIDSRRARARSIVGGAEALLREQGPSLRAARRVEPVAPAPW
jgi:hypothetical protein